MVQLPLAPLTSGPPRLNSCLVPQGSLTALQAAVIRP